MDNLRRNIHAVQSGKTLTWDAVALVEAMRGTWPTSISLPTAAMLLQKGELIRPDIGHVVVHQGDEARAIYIMLEGSAIVVRVDSNGREFTVSEIFSGEGYGFVSSYTKKPDTTSLIARKAMVALMIPVEIWFAISDSKPELKDAVVAVMCRRMQWMTDNMEYRSTTPAIVAMAHRLYTHALQVAPQECASKQEEVNIEAKISQATLASMLSLSRQRTHLLLHRLEDEGAVSLGYGRIVIRNVQALRRKMDAHETR
jgi:CRP-like cAMP-binding protein